MTVQQAYDTLVQVKCVLDAASWDLAILLIPLVVPMIWGNVHCIFRSLELIAILTVGLQA
jgi:hypothetical protein